MNKSEIYGVTWTDMLFGLTGTAIFIVILYLFSGLL